MVVAQGGEGDALSVLVRLPSVADMSRSASGWTTGTNKARKSRTVARRDALVILVRSTICGHEKIPAAGVRRGRARGCVRAYYTALSMNARKNSASSPESLNTSAVLSWDVVANHTVPSR